MPELNDDWRKYFKEALHTPDGVVTAVTSGFFLLMAAFPSLLTQMGKMIGVQVTWRVGSISLLLLPMLFIVGYIWLNSLTKTTKRWAVINAVLIFWAAALFLFKSIRIE